LFKAFNDGDLATLNEISDRRRTIHTATGSTTRDGEPRKTLAEACPMCASLNPRTITIDFIMAEGDLVTVRSTWRGKYSGTTRDVPITGKDVTVYYTNTYRLKDGRMVENWAAYDRLHLLEQLGFSVAPPR
jgi:predicted SnoaL-like aldol condensation-catalyzing enzyme